MVSGEDGTFWIEISDFRKYYEGVQSHEIKTLKNNLILRSQPANTMKTIFMTR